MFTFNLQLSLKLQSMVIVAWIHVAFLTIADTRASFNLMEPRWSFSSLHSSSFEIKYSEKFFIF